IAQSQRAASRHSRRYLGHVPTQHAPAARPQTIAFRPSTAGIDRQLTPVPSPTRRHPPHPLPLPRTPPRLGPPPAPPPPPPRPPSAPAPPTPCPVGPNSNWARRWSPSRPAAPIGPTRPCSEDAPVPPSSTRLVVSAPGDPAPPMRVKG